MGISGLLNKVRGIFGSSIAQGGKKSSARFERTMRAPRVRVTTLHRLSFDCRNLAPQVSKPVEIANISATGIGLVNDGKIQWPSPGATLEGSLRFENEKFEVRLEIMHVGDSAVGCRYLGATDELQRFLLRYFRIETSAARMVQVNPDVLRAEEDGSPRLFRGLDNCELYLVEKNSKLVRFSLVFFGNHIESDAAGSTRFASNSGALKRDEISAAIKFVQNIEGLPIDLCEAICVRLRGISG